MAADDPGTRSAAAMVLIQWSISFEGRAPVDKIYGCLILKWAAMTFKNRVQGQYSLPATAAMVAYSVEKSPCIFPSFKKNKDVRKSTTGIL